MKECSNKGLSEAQIRDQIKKSHGRKVENFDLAMFNNKMVVGGPVKNITKIKQLFVRQILKKYSKYKNSICRNIFVTVYLFLDLWYLIIIRVKTHLL